MPNVLKWKKYLSQQDLYTGDVFSPEMDDDFKRAIASFEFYITKRIPVVKGMIWKDNQIKTTVQDAKEAMHLLSLLEKRGQATLDALGPPEDNRSSIFNQMFISQDDAKSNEWSPNKNQNQGTWQNPVPKKDHESEEKSSEKADGIELMKQPETAENVNDKMTRIFNFIDFLKK